MRRFEWWLWTCGPFWNRTGHVGNKELFNELGIMSSICPGSEVAVGTFYCAKKYGYIWGMRPYDSRIEMTYQDY
ncbi:hypothetical protein D3C74_74890 [compost metagenome]